MNEYEKILNEFNEKDIRKEEQEENEELITRLKQAGSYEEKAEIILEEQAQNTCFKLFGFLILFIILGNIFFDPPMLFHKYGHFGFILHPIKCIKDWYFEWGPGLKSFIFSMTGLKHYFSAIPIIFAKAGIFRALFAYLTQFSPVWGFIPLMLLVKAVSSSVTESILSQKTELAKYLEEKDKAGEKNMDSEKDE